MATTLYFRSTTTLASRPELGPTNYQTTWGAATLQNVAGTWARDLITTAGSGTGISGNYIFSSPAGPLTSPGACYGASSYSPLWVSPPISSQVTISSTVTFNVWHSESSMSANAAVGFVVWAVRPDGTQALIVSSNRGTESGTSLAESSWTASPTSTTLYPGDCIAACLYWDDATSVTMNSGYSLLYGYDGGTSTGQYDTNIQFTENLSFVSSPSGTTTNLLADASDVSGTGKKKLWTDAASGSATYTVNTVDYGTTGQTQWTDTAGGNTLEWYTPQVQGVTIQGLFTASLRGSTTETVGRPTYLVRVYKTDGDGSNATQIGVGRAASGLGTSTSQITFNGHINGTLTNGQRLKVQVWQTSAELLASISGYTASVIVEDTTLSTIQWPATLTEYSPLSPLENATWGFIPI